MSTKSLADPPADRDDPAHSQSDVAAVLEQFGSGRPVDPEVAERVRARAEQVTKGIRRDHGLVDDDTFQALLDDDARGTSSTSPPRSAGSCRARRRPGPCGCATSTAAESTR